MKPKPVVEPVTTWGGSVVHWLPEPPDLADESYDRDWYDNPVLCGLLPPLPLPSDDPEAEEPCRWDSDSWDTDSEWPVPVADFCPECLAKLNELRRGEAP